MNNPFKAGDKVTTKIKGQAVEAEVTQTWNNEVQIRTQDKKLLWRVVKTVTLIERPAHPPDAPTGESGLVPSEQASKTAVRPGPALPHTSKIKRKKKSGSKPGAYKRTRPRKFRQPKI